MTRSRKKNFRIECMDTYRTGQLLALSGDAE